jgi:hypothetical protein
VPGLTIADAAIAIGGDLAGFDKSLDVAKGKATTLGGTLKGIFSPKNIMAGIGAAGGAALGAALSGANQLDAAARQLQADAGLTAVEAKKAEHALAGMYRNNLQGFDEIGAAMAAVHNDLGLAGDAADAMTAKFLKFATATKQDAAGAVMAFDDILDAWNLTAADAGGIMDKLIVSHQKFGGVISESQAALKTMAPAMQAANMSIDDGIALLNLFNAAGIDAAKAPAALARAVAQLKPGQSLDDLIAQIASIEDPTMRGQKAMEIFGVRGGIQLAQAFKPGIQSLDDFAVSAAGAAGATDEAAKAIQEGFGNKFKQLMKNAGGFLAEFGTNFGDVVMIASAFGPQLAKAIGAGLAGLAGLLIPKIAAELGQTLPAWIAGGKAGGAAAGAAAGTSFAGQFIMGATGAGIAVWLGDLIRDALNKAIPTGAPTAPGFFDMLFSGGKSLEDHVNSMGSKAAAAGADAGAAATEGVKYGLVSGKPGVANAAGKVGDAIRDPIASAARFVYKTLFDTMQLTADEFRSKWAELTSIGNDAAAAIYGVQNRASALAANGREIAAQQEILASKKSTGAQKQDARDRLLALQQEGLGIRIEMAGRGELSKKAYATLISTLQKQAKSGNAEVANAARLALAELEKLLSAWSALPPTLRRDFTGGQGKGGFATGTPYVPYDMVAQIHQGEIIVPRAQSDAIRAGRATLGAGGDTGGSLTVNIYPDRDTSLQTAGRFGQAVLDVVANGLREQRARSAS